jgi:hypothetical protein
LAATLPKIAEFNTKSEDSKMLGLLNTIDCFIMRYVGLIHKFKRKICKEKTCIFMENNPLQMNISIMAAISSLVGLPGVLEITLPKILTQGPGGRHFIKMADLNFQNIFMFN